MALFCPGLSDKNSFYMTAQKSPKAVWIGGFLLSLVSFPLSHDSVRFSEVSSLRTALYFLKKLAGTVDLQQEVVFWMYLVAFWARPDLTVLNRGEQEGCRAR